MENDYEYHTAQASHTLYAYPYVMNVNYIYTPTYPRTRNLVKYPLKGSEQATIKTPIFIVNASIRSAKNTYLQSEYRHSQNSSSIDDIYPIAVRYADIDRNIFLVERPPFKVPIDFYSSKKYNAKIPSYLKGRSIWIPWSLFAVNLNNDLDQIHTGLYYNNKSIDSLDDVVVRAYTPNVFMDARICFGNTFHSFLQRINSGDLKYNISNVYNYLFNDYFHQWNLDISPPITTWCFDWMKKNGIFDRIKDTENPKKVHKYFYNFHYWMRHRKLAWPFILYSLSFLSFEESMQFLGDYKDYVWAPYKDQEDHHEYYPTYSTTNAAKPVRNIIEMLYYQDRRSLENARENSSSFDLDCSTIIYNSWGRFVNDTLEYDNFTLEVPYKITIVDHPTMLALPTKDSVNLASMINESNITNMIYARFVSDLEKAVERLKINNSQEAYIDYLNLDTLFGFNSNNGSNVDHTHLFNDFNMILSNLALDNEIKLSYNDLAKDGSAHVGVN